MRFALVGRGGAALLQQALDLRHRRREILPGAGPARAVDARRAVERVDHDGSDELEADEMLECLAEIGVTPSRDAVAAVIAEYRQAALNAREAGFDGVELHCTSGYLPMQFMASGSNQRTDHYGGTVESRVRFPTEVLAAMASAIGAGRVGFRLCPGNPYNDISDTDPAATAAALCRAVEPLGLAYLHIMRSPVAELDAFALARRSSGSGLILNDGFDGASAAAALAAGQGMAVSFARHFIGNPDLVERLRAGLPLAGFDRKTLYTKGSQGYSDYPNHA